MRQFVEKCWNRPNLAFDDLLGPNLWPDLKKNSDNFVMLFYVLSNAAYCVSLRGPRAKLEEAINDPHQVVENLEAQHAAA